MTLTTVTSLTPSCWPAITDGAGRFIGVAIGLHRIDYRFVPAPGQGDPTGYVSSELFGAPPSFVAPQPSGFHVADPGGAPGPTEPLRVFDERGNFVRDGGTIGWPWAIAPDPSGGSATYTWVGVDGPRRLETVDAAGDLLGSFVMDREIDAMAVSRSGDVLAVARGDARWFDRGAKPLTDWFSLGAPVLPALGAAGQPALLANGTMGVHDADRWFAVVQDGKSGVAPPPAWLSGRPVVLEILQGGAANAFISFAPHGTPCAPSIEIVAASGRSCGTVQLPSAPDACYAVDVGKDGTVMASAATADPSANTLTCVWRWWPGLLR